MKKTFNFKKVNCLLIVFCCICGILFAVKINAYPTQKSVKASSLEGAITGGEEFRQAVENAEDGDVFTVSGEIILFGEILVQKNITVKKADTAQTAIFKLSKEPLNTARHFIIGKNCEAAFIGVSFQGHGQSYVSESYIPQGGGITALSGAKLTLSQCSFFGNRGRNGSAVELTDGGSLQAYNCRFAQNHGTGSGGALYSTSFNGAAFCKAVLVNSIFENNSASYYGGGICFDDYTEGTVKNCIIINNKTTVNANASRNGGGGIAAGRSKVLISESVISSNESNNGGGLYFYEYTDASVSDSIISKNSAARYGGGIYSSFKSVLFFYGCSIYDNVSERGGGAYIGEQFDSRFGVESKADFVFCTVAFNRSSWEGGGIYVIESFTSVYGTVIAGNTETESIFPSEPFQYTADSVCCKEYASIFMEDVTNGGKIKIRPYSSAHDKILQSDMDNWQVDISALLSQSGFSAREIQGQAYDIGAYELIEYNVTFMADENLYDALKFFESELIVLPVTPEKSGYRFSDWCTDSDLKTAYEIMPLAGDLILYARWERLPPVPFPWIILLPVSGGVFLFAGLFIAGYIITYKKRILKLAQGVNIINAANVSYPELDALTPREMEVFEFLIVGNTLRQIQGELKMAYETVHFHYKNIYKKLKVNSRIELIKKFSNYKN